MTAHSKGQGDVYERAEEFVERAHLTDKFPSAAKLMAFIESELDRISELK